MRKHKGKKQRGSRRPPSRQEAVRNNGTWKGRIIILGGVCGAAILVLLITRAFWRARKGSEEGARQVLGRTDVTAEDSARLAPQLPDAKDDQLAWAKPEHCTEEDLERETMAALTRLAQDFPNSADPFGLMGDVYVELGKTAEAMACWDKCTELEPHRADSYVRLAGTAVERGEFDRALAIAERALNVDPAMPGIHRQLGRALQGLAEPMEALAAFKKAVAVSPQSALDHHLLGQAYQQAQRYERAKQSYLKALQINPNYTEACYGIVAASARLGQMDEAAEYRRKFKGMKARDWEALPDKRDYVLHHRLLVRSRHRASKTHTNAGMLYYDHGQRQTAERHWRRAAALDPVNTGCREELATLYQQDGRNEEALQVCEQLIQLAPKNPQYHMCAGTLLIRMNRVEEAQAVVKRAVVLDPSNTTYQRIYEQIQSE